MREIYWPHRHNGRRDAQDITVIPYFRAMRARARARRGVARRSAPLCVSDFNTSNYRGWNGTGHVGPDRERERETPLVARLSRAVSACNFAESSFNAALTSSPDIADTPRFKFD